MANYTNHRNIDKSGLVRFSDMDKEKARELARKGGINSQKKQREKRAMKEALKILLNLKLNGGKQFNIENAKTLGDIVGATGLQNVTVQEAMLLKQISKALKGDTRAFEIIRDTAGEKPQEEVAVKTESSIHDNLLKKIEERKVDGVDD